MAGKKSAWSEERTIVNQETLTTTRNKKWLLIFAILGGLVLCMTVCFQLLLKRCILWTCAPQRSFSIIDLSIPSGFFPEGATVGQMGYKHENEGALTSSSMNANWEKGMGVAGYAIWQFGSSQSVDPFWKRLIYTAREFDDCLKVKYRSPYADKFAVRCGIIKYSGGYSAGLYAQYGEFAVGFGTIIDDQMSLEDFEKIIIYIDEDFASRLNLK